MENSKEQIDEIPFYEKEPVISSENFEVYYDEKIEEIIENPERFIEKIHEAQEIIENTLDEKW
ncbi:hypothetical protein ACFL24_00730 [Patescibacteria group bacterium]